MLRFFKNSLHSSNILCLFFFFFFNVWALTHVFHLYGTFFPHPYSSSLHVINSDSQSWHRCHCFIESFFHGSRLGQIPFLCIPIELCGSSIIAFFAHCYASLLPLIGLKNTEGKKKKKNPTAKLFTIVFLVTNVLPNI